MIGDDEPTLASGYRATHIGPETGNTGSATAGEGSGAGTQEQAVPAAAAGLDDAVPAPGGSEEARSFQPKDRASPNPRPPSDAPLDIDDDVRDITDGKDRPDHKH